MDKFHPKSFGSPTLPLYKDKPHAPLAFAPARPSQRTRRTLFRVFLLLVVLYTLFYILRAPSHKPLESAVSWDTARQQVKDVFLESWDLYVQQAWGMDEFRPESGTGKNMGPRPLGWIIVDSLDTLWLMDAKDEFARARKWVQTELKYDFDYNVNVFETTIRMLGGLLSAHHLLGDDVFLDRAADLGNALLGGYKTKTGIPELSVNLLSGEALPNKFDGGALLTAEAATLQLEMRYLSKLTGELLYWKAAEKVMAVLDSNQPDDGLVPIYVRPDTGKYHGLLMRMGLRGDLYYEYLLKQYLQTNHKEPVYWDMYRESVAGVRKHMVGALKPSGLKFVGELENGLAGGLSPKMDHLVCFYPGLLALGATNGLTLKEARKLPHWDAEKAADFQLAEELTHLCYKMYHDTPTGLAPEIVVFNTDESVDSDMTVRAADRHNLQRPETVELLYYMYKFTKDEKYRKWGYEIFKSFVKHTRVVSPAGFVGYTLIDNVMSTAPLLRNNMESFWLAETLKYLYLLFDDSDQLPLDKYVFNTEAHPFPRFDMEPFSTGWSRHPSDPRSRVVHLPSVGADEAVKKPVKDTGKAPPVGDTVEVPKVDKKNPPQAAPVAKKVDKEAQEELKKDPLLAENKKVAV